MPIAPSNPFKGRHFPGEVILLGRWYLRYPLATATLPNFCGTWRGRGPQLCLAVGTGLRTRIE